jgi:hypothetical protein
MPTLKELQDEIRKGQQPSLRDLFLAIIEGEKVPRQDQINTVLTETGLDLSQVPDRLSKVAIETMRASRSGNTNTDLQIGLAREFEKLDQLTDIQSQLKRLEVAWNLVNEIFQNQPELNLTVGTANSFVRGLVQLPPLEEKFVPLPVLPIQIPTTSFIDTLSQELANDNSRLNSQSTSARLLASTETRFPAAKLIQEFQLSDIHPVALAQTLQQGLRNLKYVQLPPGNNPNIKEVAIPEPAETEKVLRTLMSGSPEAKEIYDNLHGFASPKGRLVLEQLWQQIQSRHPEINMPNVPDLPSNPEDLLTGDLFTLKEKPQVPQDFNFLMAALRTGKNGRLLSDSVSNFRITAYGDQAEKSADVGGKKGALPIHRIADQEQNALNGLKNQLSMLKADASRVGAKTVGELIQRHGANKYNSDITNTLSQFSDISIDSLAERLPQAIQMSIGHGSKPKDVTGLKKFLTKKS